MNKIFPFIFFYLLMGVGIYAQNFLNGELAGTIGVSSTPTNWAQVPFNDPLSQADVATGATSDVTGSTGPIAGNICVNPYSGTTVVTGLHMSIGTSVWHEGMQQSVAGFTIGNTYRISFWQTVTKQSNATDNTGSWAVYRDGVLIAVSAPTTSTLPVGSTSRVWEKRYMTFTATAATHLIKFLPMDDDANIVSPDGVRMGIDSVELDPFSPLPIELIAFDAQYKDHQVELSWSTATEINNDYFTIERSSDAIHFEEIARIVGAGNSNAVVHYSDVDQDPLSGTSFYRLKQTDYDGLFQYSEMTSVTISEEEAVLVYPNPILKNNTITVQGNYDAHDLFELLDEMGTVVKSSLNSNSTMDLIGIPTGIYFLRIRSNEELTIKRIVIY